MQLQRKHDPGKEKNESIFNGYVNVQKKNKTAKQTVSAIPPLKP
jgi:hypothetical protein